MKIRPATSTIGQMVTALGGTNVQASAPESRDMLERGVADAITFPWGSIGLFGIDKVVSYHMDVPLYVTPFVWVMNQSKYDAMSVAQKKVIDDHCTTEWAEKVAAPWADFEFGGHAKIAAQSGHEVLQADARATDRLAPGRGGRRNPVGRVGEKGRPGPDRRHAVAQGQPGQIQVGTLTASLTPARKQGTCG